MKKQLLFLFSVLILISLVSAVPPVTITQQFSTGYIIEDNPQTILKQNQTYQVNFFVYNISNGELITPENALCDFYLANSSGNVLIFTNVSYNADGHWEENIEAGNFSEIGYYNYGIKCQGTNLGGAIVGLWEVKTIGIEKTEFQGFAIFSYLFLMLTLTIMFGWMGFKFSDSDKLWVLGILFIFLSMLFVVYDVWLGYEYHKNYTGASSSGMPEMIFNIFLFILVAGLVISAVLLFTKWEKLVKRFRQELKDKQFKLERDEIDRSFDF